MKVNWLSPPGTGEFALCVFIVPLIILAVLCIPLEVSGLGATADFIQFYSAGAVVAGGEAPQLYDLALQSEVLRQFTHPPFETILYAPFAFLSYKSAFRLWTLLSLCSLGLIFFLLRPYGSAFSLSERLLLLSALFYPVFLAIVQGQDSLLVFAGFHICIFQTETKSTFLGWNVTWGRACQTTISFAFRSSSRFTGLLENYRRPSNGGRLARTPFHSRVWASRSCSISFDVVAYE